MAGYDARFWELSFDPGDFDAIPSDLFTIEEHTSPEAARVRSEVLIALAQLVRTLTDRQRQIVELYFYDGMTQADIAGALGISQQAVSRQLFGVVRSGRRVGGAIQRLRKIAIDEGWDPSEWV